MGKLRMGYVGGGGGMAQRVHIPNILLLDECELVAIAEVRRDLGERVQQRHRIPRLYNSHLELAADQGIQAVAVSGRFSAQGELAIDLLLAGKDVFMEKPMAVSVEQAERILQAERKSGRRLMVGYMKRYDAGNVRVKELIDGFRVSGELGSIRFVRNHGFCGDWTAGLDTPREHSDQPIPEPPARWPAWLPDKFHAGYLSYLQQYCHNVNLLRWFLGEEGTGKVKSVDLDADGTAGIVVLEVGGVRTVIESGSVSYHAWDEHTQVYFEHGWIRTCAPPILLRNLPATVEVYRGERGEKTRTEIFPAAGWTWSFKEEMRHFVRCVRDGEPFRSPAADAMQDVRLIEDIYRCYVQSAAGG